MAEREPLTPPELPLSEFERLEFEVIATRVHLEVLRDEVRELRGAVERIQAQYARDEESE